MIVEIEKPRYEASELGIKMTAESHKDTVLLFVIAKRIKKPLKTFGFMFQTSAVLNIVIPIRKQKQSDDEFGNQ